MHEAHTFSSSVPLYNKNIYKYAEQLFVELLPEKEQMVQYSVSLNAWLLSKRKSSVCIDKSTTEQITQMTSNVSYISMRMYYDFMHHVWL